MPIARFQMPDGRIGRFEVPEGTSPEQAQSMISEMVSQQTKQPQQTMAEKIENDPISRGARDAQKRSTIEEIGRQTLLTGRYGLEGLGGGVIADKLDLPKPEGKFERVIGDAARTMATGGLIGGVAGQSAQMLSGVPRAIAEMLASQPVQQLVSSGVSGAASGTAREGGAGQWGQMGAGFAAGLAVPLAGAGLAKLGEKVADAGATIGAAYGNRRGIDRIVGQAIREGADDTGAIQQHILANVPEQVPGLKQDVAAALAQANQGSGGQIGGRTIRLQKDLTGAKGIEDVLLGNRAAQMQQVDDFVKQVTELTTPLREKALRNANIGGIKGNELRAIVNQRLADAAKESETVRRMGRIGNLAEDVSYGNKPRLDSGAPPAPGYVKTPGKYGYGAELKGVAENAMDDAAAKSLQRGAEARFAQMQLDSIEQSGLRPLKGDSIIDGIQSIKKNPQNPKGSMRDKILTKVQTLIAKNIDEETGVINADTLYSLRKDEIGKLINKLVKPQKPSDEKYAGALLRNSQKLIDKAIKEAGGGKEWDDYLAMYSEGMRRKDAVLNAMKSADEIASQVKSSSPQEIARGDLPTIPNMLSRPVAWTNLGLRLIAKDANTPVTKKIAEAMTDPEVYARYLRMPETSTLGRQARDIAQRAAIATAAYEAQQ